MLQKIKGLQDTQKALKEQNEERPEMKNALKRKKSFLESKACPLSDSDLMEVLRMRKARKEGVQTVPSPPT